MDLLVENFLSNIYNKKYRGNIGESMNKTKRKIFDASMKLFAEKGYDATSVEEITGAVGVAKGTLYYHFSSKEEIFNFLVDEGTKLLLNNMEIKTKKLENSLDKLRAISILQIRVLKKYENLITIILSQIYGTDSRSKKCRDTVLTYVAEVEKIVKCGMQKGEIKEGNSSIVATEIFAFTFITMVEKVKNGEEIDVRKYSLEFDNLLKGLANNKGE